MQSRFINSNWSSSTVWGGGWGGNPLDVAVFCSAASSLPHSSSCRLASRHSHLFLYISGSSQSFKSQAPHPRPLGWVNSLDGLRTWSKEQLHWWLMLKGGFFIDGCCGREVWLRQEEDVFGGQGHSVPASSWGQIKGGGFAIPGGCQGKERQILGKPLPGAILSGNGLTDPYFQWLLCLFLS